MLRVLEAIHLGRTPKQLDTAGQPGISETAIAPIGINGILSPEDIAQ